MLGFCKDLVNQSGGFLLDQVHCYIFSTSITKEPNRNMGSVASNMEHMWVSYKAYTHHDMHTFFHVLHEYVHTHQLF